MLKLGRNNKNLFLNLKQNGYCQMKMFSGWLPQPQKWVHQWSMHFRTQMINYPICNYELSMSCSCLLKISLVDLLYQEEIILGPALEDTSSPSAASTAGASVPFKFGHHLASCASRTRCRTTPLIPQSGMGQAGRAAGLGIQQTRIFADQVIRVAQILTA